MKKQFFIAMALISVACSTNPLFAQDAAASKSAGYDLKKNVKCRVVSTENGSAIFFDGYEARAREAGSGMATGKRQYQPIIIRKEFKVSSSDNSVAEVKSPSDAASGMATGKRMHEPIRITKRIDKSSPKIAKNVSKDDTEDATATMGAGKDSLSDIHFTMEYGGDSRELAVVDGACTIPSDLYDGEYVLTASWSWGATNSGSSKRCSVDFLLEIRDGVCMAINTKGTGASNK